MAAIHRHHISHTNSATIWRSRYLVNTINIIYDHLGQEPSNNPALVLIEMKY
jgi:hypothetical protein